MRLLSRTRPQESAVSRRGLVVLALGVAAAGCGVTPDTVVGPASQASNSATSVPSASTTSSGGSWPTPTAPAPATTSDTNPVRFLANENADYTRFVGYAEVQRPGDRAARPAERARGLIRALAAGPTQAERSRGLAATDFPSDPALVRAVDVQGSRLIIDFNRPIIEEAALNSDEGGAGLLASLLANVFAIESIDTLELRGDGSCETFAAWAGSEGCVVRTRQQASEWQATTAAAEPAPLPAPKPPADDPERYCGTSQPNCTEPGA